MSTIQEIAQLRQRIERIEGILRKHDLLENEPEPIKQPDVPSAIAHGDYYDEAGTGFVHIMYTFDCPQCLTEHDHAIRIPTTTANPFRHRFECDKGPVSVFFHRQNKGRIA